MQIKRYNKSTTLPMQGNKLEGWIHIMSETKKTFISPLGVMTVWVPEEVDLALFCLQNEYIFVDEMKRELFCFPESLACATEKQRRAIRNYEELDYKIKLWNLKK